MSEKGGVSVYGLGRFPVTLYYEQWTRLLGAVDELAQNLGAIGEFTPTGAHHVTEDNGPGASALVRAREEDLFR